MPYNLDGTSKNQGGGVTPGGGGGKKTTIGGSPGLLTSTGGLQGTTGMFVVPYMDLLLNRNYFVTWDPTDFNTEEDCSYYFKQEDIQIGRVVTVHKVILTYRLIGNVKFTVGVSGFFEDVKDSTPGQTGKFVKKEVTVYFSVPPGTKADNKLHTKSVDIKLSCERPQLYLIRKANSGPLSITKAVMVGTADEGQQL